MGKDGPLSRRGFLRTSAESAAAAIAAGAVVGCQGKPEGIYPKYLEDKAGLMPLPAIDRMRQVTADEGDYAVGKYLQETLQVDSDAAQVTSPQTASTGQIHFLWERGGYER